MFKFMPNYCVIPCIRGKMGAQNVVQEIKQYQKKWLQHVQRMDTNRIPKQALQYKPKGRRNVGRPRKIWRDQLRLEDQGTGNMPNPSRTWWWWWWWYCVIPCISDYELKKGYWLVFREIQYTQSLCNTHTSSVSKTSGGSISVPYWFSKTQTSNIQPHTVQTKFTAVTFTTVSKR